MASRNTVEQCYNELKVRKVVFSLISYSHRTVVNVEDYAHQDNLRN